MTALPVVLMSKKKAEQLGLKPLARIVAGSAAGVDPRIMGIGPSAATYKFLKALEPQDINIDSFELFEINEAFAARFPNYQM